MRKDDIGISNNKTSAIADKKRHASLRLFVIVLHCYGKVRFIIYSITQTVSQVGAATIDLFSLRKLVS